MDAPWGAPSTAPLSNLNVFPFQERVAKLKSKIVWDVLKIQRSPFQAGDEKLWNKLEVTY